MSHRFFPLAFHSWQQSTLFLCSSWQTASGGVQKSAVIINVQSVGDLAPEKCWKSSKAHCTSAKSCFGTTIWLCFQAGGGVGHLQHHLQQPFLLVIPVGVSSTRFFSGLSLPEVLTALAAQEALGQLGPAKLCVSLFLQAILGKLLFGETWTPLWWVGLAVTVCGLMLLHTAAPQLVQVPAEKKE